jgi:serine phosphatase RsbU (regulator of sigma subunit)
VEALESVAYPLGVRLELEVATRTARLADGDTVFLCSDGVVEATSRTGDEPFGFARLEQTLSRHCLDSVEAMRDGVLRDLGRFTGPAPRQDDQTLLVLRVSA